MVSVDQLVKIMQEWVGISIHRSMQELDSFARQSGLSPTQMRLLMWLHYHAENCTVSDVADKLEITNPAASQLVQRLVESGLVERQEAAHDRRAKEITLTTGGQTAVNEAMAVQRRWMRSVAARMDDEGRAQAISGLKALIQTAGTMMDTLEKQSDEES